MQSNAKQSANTWEVVKGLRVSMGASVELTTQAFRTQHWFVLVDRDSGETYRVSDSLKFVFEQSSADLTVGAALALDSQHIDEEQKEQIALALVQLYRAHLIEFAPVDNVPGELKQLRANQPAKKKRFNPLSIRVPLCDPDRLFSALKPSTDRLFYPLALVLLITTALLGMAVGLAHMREIGSDVLSQLETPAHWWIFVAAYIVLKLIHETAHGFAVKRWNGHIHDVGVMLLVFFPVPYVDASASNAFQDKYQRISVAAAGIVAEALCASLAVFAWLAMEPGLLRTFAFDIILIGGVSTLLFNGNPLMRFDAYFVLADYLEIPNLFARSRKYLDYFLIRYFLGDSTNSRVTDSRSEAGWLLSYAVGSSIYRLVIMVGITTYLVDSFFFVGVALAAWVATAQIILPVWRFALQLRRSDTNSQRRFGLLARFAVISGAALLAVSFIPFPQTTVAHGIVTVEDDAHIRAEVSGFVTQSTIDTRSIVQAQDVVASLNNPELQRNQAVAVASIKAIQSEMQAAYRDGVEIGLFNETLRARQEELREIETRIANLNITSAITGNVVPASAKTITDRYVQKGETIGYVVASDHLIVRLVLTESDLAMVQEDVDSVELMVMSELGHAYAAKVLRVVPSTLLNLPSKALGTAADGGIAVDPTDEDGVKPLENVFQVDVKTLEPLANVNVATRAYARFVHSPEPLLPRALRAVRRLFLARFSV
ncbi:MAG: hypothetical protein AAF387_10840 [Pseudomonadota bacterium]